jgi:hypothetical protein
VTLSPRDVSYLSALGQLADDAGWCQSTRGRRLDVSGLSWGQWRGAQARMLKTGHAEKRPGADHACGEADPVRLTPRGLAALDQHRSAQVQHRSPAQVSTPPESLSSPSLLKTKEKREPIPGVLPAQGGVLRIECPALDRLAAALEKVAPGLVGAVESQLAALMDRDRKPQKPTHCPCGAPLKPVRKGNGQTFDGCSAYPCPFTERKPKSDDQGGPRISSARAEKERRERLEAKVRALADQKRATLEERTA